MTDEQIAAAYRIGRLAAKAGRTDCPFDANGDFDQRIQARYWVKGRLDGGGQPIDDGDQQG